MLDFDKQFNSLENPIFDAINYKGKELIRRDKLNIYANKKTEIIVRLISVNSEYRQGICVHVSKGNIYDLKAETKGKNYILWQELYSQFYTTGECKLQIKTKDGYFVVWNAWDYGIHDYTITSFNELGAAMIKEKIRDGLYRYYCNDGHKDENFDDIVFEVEIL
jgi:hypothetical protein